MDILINHLTRMQQGYVCVAGIDIESLRHIRPVRVGIRLRTGSLAGRGGAFDMGRMVRLGAVRAVGSPPEVEDHEPDWPRVRSLEVVEGRQFWEYLKRVAKPTLSALFGPELKMRGRNSCGIDLGVGSASLGCLSSPRGPRIYVKPRPPKPDQVRISFGDGHFGVDVGVTDIRLYGADHVTPDAAVIERVSKRLGSKEPVILAVGVGRPPPSGPGDLPPVHWLQVNNIHFADDPVWQLG